MKKIFIREGVFYIDRKTLFLLSADYPYYRDRAVNWEDRLEKIKESGVETVTAYIPWRHHVSRDKKGKITYDFDGLNRDNTNIRKFAALAKKTKLYLILKPGPFIHAEVNFGGLPDWVSPEENKNICPLTAFNKKPVMWMGKILPSPYDKEFLKNVLQWLSKVDKEILSKIAYPKGNLIGIQLANEGIYSNASDSISCFDYSLPSLKLYKNFLRQKYPYAKKSNLPRVITGRETRQELVNFIAWSDFQSFYYRGLLKIWKGAFKTKAPFMVNINPPSSEDIDSWLSRNVPEELEKAGLQYAYTDWIGLPQEDEGVRNRHMITARRAKGFNLEDNWGFSKLYDKRYKHCEIPFYQSLFTIACGAKGFNVYTGVSTAHWDVNLDNQHDIPYPETAPINKNGETGEKYEALKLIASFFKDHGEDFLESSLYAPIAWGLYLPYAHVCSWIKNKEDFLALGLEEVSGGQALLEFTKTLCENHIAFDIINLSFADRNTLNSKRAIVFEGGFFVDEKTQRKLSDYVRHGGILVITKKAPWCNEFFEKRPILERCFNKQEKGRLILVPGKEDLLKVLQEKGILEAKIANNDKKLCLFLYEHHKRDIQFLFVFNELEEERFAEIKIGDKNLGLKLAKKGVVLIKLEDGRLKAILSKNRNEFYNSRIIPEFILGKEKFKLNEAVDFYAVKDRGEWKISKTRS